MATITTRISFNRKQGIGPYSLRALQFSAALPIEDQIVVIKNGQVVSDFDYTVQYDNLILAYPLVVQDVLTVERVTATNSLYANFAAYGNAPAEGTLLDLQQLQFVDQELYNRVDNLVLDLQGQIDNLEAALQIDPSDLVQLFADVVILKDEMDAVEADIVRIDLTVGGFSSAIDSIVAENVLINSRIDTVANDQATQALAIQTNANNISAIDTDFSAIDAAILANTALINTNINDIATNTTDIVDVDARLIAAEGTIVTQTGDISSLDTRTTAVEAVSAANASDLSTLNPTVTGLVNTSAAHATQINTNTGNITANANAIAQITGTGTATALSDLTDVDLAGLTDGEFIAWNAVDQLWEPSVGGQGPQGPQGPQGDEGSDGKSAYQIWLDAGNVGTEADYLASLQGPLGLTGAQGAAGTDGVGIPEGGVTGQVLAKVDNSDYNTQWVNQTGGGGGGTPAAIDGGFADSTYGA